MLSGCRQRHETSWMRLRADWVLVLWALIVFAFIGQVQCMTPAQLAHLRRGTEELFYHGFDNYMKYGYPDDELKPVSCKPLTRDRADPSHIALNDPLGNYSLTLIDSLSTLAVLASSSGPEVKRRTAFKHFQDGVASLVELYGDGSSGKKSKGQRAQGFDLDSKVQVFETVIRGVGGLLSAHLFAVGELPILGYDVHRLASVDRQGVQRIKWSKKFTYDGQLLRLAKDLAARLLPAFTTTTGIPYPRVNLRHGIPFYLNSPLSCNNENSTLHTKDPQACPAVNIEEIEITETCSAGAGSLLLEFSVLSRLTDDFRFEHLAKRAFWAIWDRRSSIGLIGSTIDAESGLWTQPYTGLGAGIDSFFEYAMKSYVLLSGSDSSYANRSAADAWFSAFRTPPLKSDDHDPESFLVAWQDAHAAIKRHVYRGPGSVHPHYIQSDLFTGANRAHWMDALSAFYPGLLVLAGQVEEAIETHLLFTALWHRYSGIPERWSTMTGSIEAGLGWWLGRPEFIESTWYLYRATRDPFYLHVGEMALADIKRRCWAECGLSGLQDVRLGNQNDRMESFFLGETVKYLHLLFDPDHPLNKLDAPFVFSTEGHPLIIPKQHRRAHHGVSHHRAHSDPIFENEIGSCLAPAPSNASTFMVSKVVDRPDFFRAADLARLHLMPTKDDLTSPGIECAADHPSILPVGPASDELQSPSNFAYYPWTLPLALIPPNGTSTAREPTHTFDITFPSSPSLFQNHQLQRVSNGILVNGMGGLRLGMIQDVPLADATDPAFSQFRIQTVNNVPLGRDERIYIAKDTMTGIVNPTDPNFTRVREEVMVDVAIDTISMKPREEAIDPSLVAPQTSNGTILQAPIAAATEDSGTSVMQSLLRLIAEQASSMRSGGSSPAVLDPAIDRHYLAGIMPNGPGHALLPETHEFLSPSLEGKPQGTLIWKHIYIGDENCDSVLPASIAKEHQVIVIKRGGCSFSEKLENIPSFAPSPLSLQLVVVVSYGTQDGLDDGRDETLLIRPHLDTMQYSSTGIPRRNPIPMLLVGGGHKTFELFEKAVAFGFKRRYSVMAQGVSITNLIII